MKESGDTPRPNLEKFRLIETRFDHLKRSSESISFEIQATTRDIDGLEAQRDHLKNKPEELEHVSRQLRELTETRAQLKARYDTTSKLTTEAITLFNNCKEFLRARGIQIE